MVKGQICSTDTRNPNQTLVSLSTQGISHTHMRTLCRAMTKDTLRLQGLTKLDQLVSMVMYSPFRAQKRMDE